MRLRRLLLHTRQLMRDGPLLALSAATLAALALLWLVRRAPLPLPLLYVDALGAFFAAAMLGGLALARVARPAEAGAPAWRLAVTATVLALAFLTSLTPAVIGAYLLAALLHAPPAGAGEPGPERPLRQGWRRALSLSPRSFALVGAACLLVGYGALALRGALRLDDRAAGAALDSFVFWFTLLAAAAPLVPLSSARPAGEAGWRALQIAWLYPLARLYTLGPWNEGWGFAALLLGAAAALRPSVAALTRPQAALPHLSLLGLALAALGLGTSAGVGAACYALLAYVVLSALPAGETGAAAALPGSLLRWAVSGALPFTAPFVAVWMLVGAGAAAGITALAGAAWLIALLNALAVALAPAGEARRPLAVAAAASVALGILAPPVVRYAIQPVIEQLQGGLTSFGDVQIWPWVGLATVGPGNRTVTALPSIAAACLMLVLTSIVYLLARLRFAAAPGGEGAAEAEAPAAQAGPRDMAGLLDELRDSVPWLGGRGRRDDDR